VRTNTKSPPEIIEKGPDLKTEAAQPTRAQKDQDHGLETEKGPDLVTGRPENQDLHPDLEIITEVVEDLEADLNLGTVKDPDLGIDPEEPVTVADPDQETDIQDQKDLDHVTKDLGHVTGNSRLTKPGENQILQIHPPLRQHPDLEFCFKQKKVRTRVAFFSFFPFLPFHK